jgi:hypothetical protein
MVAVGSQLKMPATVSLLLKTTVQVFTPVCVDGLGDTVQFEDQPPKVPEVTSVLSVTEVPTG